MGIERLNALLRRVPVWAVYLAGAIPAPVFVYLGATGGLGVEPIEALEHELGALALKLLVVGLAITPLRRLTGVNLLRFRRAVGLLAFFYMCCHLLVWLVLDVQVPAEIWADIVKRPYVTVGMAAFALMVPLAATSNDRAVRLLGPAWRRLHRLVYAGALLAGLHYVMQMKGLQFEPLAYLATIAGLLALRLPGRARRRAQRLPQRRAG